MFVRRAAYLIAIVVCAAILGGCSNSVCYQGKYFAKFGGVPLSARVYQSNCPFAFGDVSFEGVNLWQIPIGTNCLPTDASGRITTNVNWPPNVYAVEAVSHTLLCDDESKPAVLTIVGPLPRYKGIYAGGLVQPCTFLCTGITRNQSCPRPVTFGVQFPVPATPTQNPVFLLLDNDYPMGCIAIKSCDFTEEDEVLDGTDDIVARVFTGTCLFSKDQCPPMQFCFTARITNNCPRKFSIDVIDKNKCLIYTIPPTLIENGGLISQQ